MLRRVLVIAAVVLAIPMLGLPSWIALNRGDLPSPDDADLEVNRPAISTDENGFTHFRATSAGSAVWREERDVYDRLNATLRRETFDPQRIDDLARQNAALFGALESALAAPRFQLPVFHSDDEEIMDAFLGVQLLVRIAAAQARSIAAEGKTELALERALLGMKVGRMLSEAEGSHILALVFSAANQSISLGEIERLLRHDLQLTPSESRWLALQLDSYRADDEDWQSAWKAEYQWVKTTMHGEPPEVDEKVEDLWAGIEEDEAPSDWLIRHLPEEYMLHPNRTLDGLADMYRELSRRSAMTCLEWSGPDDRPDDVLFEEPSEWKAFAELLLPNYWGRTMVDMMRPSNARFLSKRCHFDTRTSLVQALAGLNAYRHATGRLPTSLGDLVPNYLPAVPQDRFDGNPLRYSAEAKTVYSVGDDFTDDGPPAEPSQTRAEAPALRL
jgi:hypothetical protein